MLQRCGVAVRPLVILLTASVLLAGAGCDDETGQSASDETVINGPAVEAGVEDVFSLSAANAAFAFDLYREMQGNPGNLFLSPYSVSAALAMTLAGARGETAAQMSDALHFDVGSDRLHQTFTELATALSLRSKLPDQIEGEGFAFHVVNAMWPQSGHPLLDAFVEALTVTYAAGLHELDFATNPEAARQTINGWVSERTKERIENLIPQGAIDTATRLVLTNAIYFNAPWREPFDPESTVVEPFTRLDGETLDVAMMHKTESLPYVKWDDGLAFEIPYNGNELAMVVLVPDTGRFEAFDASLTAERFAGIVGSFASQRIALGMPQFEFDYASSLVSPLMALGVTDAFDGARADFSGITGQRDLAISDVLHKAFVSVDEAGTEAAAATAILFRATSMPAEPLEVTVDRPFLFVIRDRPTSSILFIGRVLEP